MRRGLSLAAMSAALLVGAVSCSGRMPVGLKDGRLAPCPKTPNCVASEASEPEAAIAPFPYRGAPEEALARVKRAILETGGTVVREEGDYLAATYTSLVFRFVDDVEIRVDREQGVVHLRSASRVGSYDFGVNRKRVEKLREAYSRLK